MTLNLRVVNNDLAVKIGLKEAMLLQQIHYWMLRCGKEREGERWVYNTYKNWLEQFPYWSIMTIRRALKSLKRKGLIKTKTFSKAPWHNTPWYSINYEHALIENQLVTPSNSVCSKRTDTFYQTDQIPSTKMNRLYTKTITENKTKTNGKVGVEDLLFWLDKQSETYKYQIEEYIKIAIEKQGEKVRDKGKYRLGILRRIHAGVVKEFQPTTDSELNRLVAGMYGAPCN